MMRQNTMLHLHKQPAGKALYFCRMLRNHLGAYDNVPQQLSLIRVIILGKGGNLPDLADIMAGRRGQQQIPL